ncbi:MAG: D-amino-acid transaminase [Gammaproteobacteria bacterium]|jgi:D-alanine transaminase|nr:D-amino-acid transaminase [Gammaproteobacteria bacterium]
MPRIAYVNGAYLPHRHASVHIEDRGYQFADGAYEVVHAYRGRLIDEFAHLDRLDRTLNELSIAPPMARQSMRLVMREIVRRNRMTTGLLYIQVTRGVAPRDHRFPRSVKPTVAMTARSIPEFPREILDDGVKILTIPDIRWDRCDIKCVALLPNILAKQAAAEALAYEAWMVDSDEFVTEGSSSNAWIVTAENILITPPTGRRILAGTARQVIIRLAGELGYTVEERPFTVAEAHQAKEAFLSNSSHFVTPVTQIDNVVVANGIPGTVTIDLHEKYLLFMEDSPLISSPMG